MLPLSKNKFLFNYIFLFSFLLTIPNLSFSDENNREKELEKILDNKNAQEVRSDFFVPDSPAFSVLGVTPENVVRPESTRDLAISLLNGVDPKGNFQTGVAIDTAPYLLYGVDMADYRDKTFERFLSRSQLSIATTKGTNDDDKSVRASIGLRVTLFDKGDPRLDKGLDAEYIKVNNKIIVDYDRQMKIFEAQIEADPGNKKLVEAINEQIKALGAKKTDSEKESWSNTLKEYEKGRWNASSATLGIAPIFFSEDGSYSDVESQGYTLYGTLSYGFENLEEDNWIRKYTHLLFHVRYSADEQEALGEGLGFREQDTTIFGAQLRLKGPSIWSKDKGGDLAFSLEIDHISKEFNDGTDDDLFRYTGIIELKPFKNNGLTLKIAAGGEGGGDDDDNAFMVTSINWAFD